MFTFLNHLVIDAGLGLMPDQPPEAHKAAFDAYFEDTPMGATRRARAAEVIETQRTEFQAHDVEIGFFYPTGALVSDGTEPPAQDPMGGRYTPTTRPGHRLPHAWLERDGERISTHDLTEESSSFVLIAGADGESWCGAAAQVAKELGVAIKAVRVGDGGDYSDPTGAWGKLRQVGEDGAVLVRPDNHVAWRCPDRPNNPERALTEALKTILGR